MGEPLCMEKSVVRFPTKGPWEGKLLPVFIHPDENERHYVFVARTDIGRFMRSTSHGLKEFLQKFRQFAHTLDCKWDRFTILEIDMPYLLDKADKPNHQEAGWVGPHINSMLTLTGLAAIFHGVAGGEHALGVLFPHCTRAYLKECAKLFVQRHNELTRQQVHIEQLAVYLQDTPNTVPEKIVNGNGLNPHINRVLDETIKRKLVQRDQLKAEIDELQRKRYWCEKLAQDAQEGLVALLFFTLQEEEYEDGEDGTKKRCYVLEIDTDGAVYRKRRKDKDV